MQPRGLRGLQRGLIHAGGEPRRRRRLSIQRQQAREPKVTQVRVDKGAARALRRDDLRVVQADLRHVRANHEERLEPQTGELSSEGSKVARVVMGGVGVERERDGKGHHVERDDERQQECDDGRVRVLGIFDFTRHRTERREA